MFYRGPLDSLLYLPAFSLLVSLDSLTLVQLFTEEKKKMKGTKKKKKPCFFAPPRPGLGVPEEQTHIKHTQGAAAVIAVSAVLLWVAGDDNTSHRNIYIIFLIMSGLNHGQLEAGHILQNICAYDKHIFFGGGGTLLLFVSRRLSAPPSICIY